MNHLESVHFSPLSSQGNIYTIAVLHLANNSKKLLVASLRREVVCLDYQENSSGALIPTTKEITFTYLPSGAEIISIAAFNKSENKNDFVIGITIIKNSNDLNALETYLNIYCGWEESIDFNMDSISQNCVNNIELKFIPYHLMHTYLISWDDDGSVVKEVVFLLSGSDNKVHVYQENKATHTYKEIESEQYFLEFLNLPEIIMWLDIYYFNDYNERITAFGCESGYVRLCRISVKTATLLFNFSTRFDNTVSLVRIYPAVYDMQRPAYIKADCIEISETSRETPVLNLLVVNTTMPAVFFGDILQYGLRKYGILARFECVKVQSCGENADIDFDGNDEIIIGRHEKLIAYKFDQNAGWYITDATKQFPTAILGLKYIDLTGDGVKELIVLTMKGIHVFQHNHTFVKEALEQKLKDLSIPNIDALSLQSS